MISSPSLFFWQGRLCPHQFPLVRAVADVWPATVYYTCDLAPEVTQNADDVLERGLGRVRFRSEPSIESRKEIEALSQPGDIHIFTGLSACSGVHSSLSRLARSDAILLYHTEPWDSRGVKGYLRAIKYALRNAKWKNYIDGILTIGLQARRQLSSFGYEHKIVPYAYVTDVPEIIEERMPSGEDIFRFIFVGQLVRRKALDLLFRSLAPLSHLDWCVEIVGAGSDEISLRHLADSLGLANRVQWSGPIPLREVNIRMQFADVLVLPSRFDGWGAVVNEALLCGTRAVVSSAAGASEVITDAHQGAVFAANDCDSLTKALRAEIGRGEQTLLRRRLLREESVKRLSPQAVAAYFVGVINHFTCGTNLLEVPWQRRSDSTTP